MATSQKPTSPAAEIEEQITQIRSDIAELTRLLTSLAESKVGDAKAAAKGEVDHLLKHTRDMADAAQNKTREATETLESHIKEKPLQSAVVALMIGLLFGALSRR